MPFDTRPTPGPRWYAIAAFAAALGNAPRVDILPVHQMGRFNWKALGLQYALDDAQPPSREMVERACAAFRAAGLKAC